VDIVDEHWSGSAKMLSGTSRIVGGDPYELRIAGLCDGDKIWKLVSAKVSAADQAAGVTLAPKPVRIAEKGWIRVLIKSEQSRSVKWLLKFGFERNT